MLNLAELSKTSFRDPAKAAVELIGLQMGRGAVLSFLALSICLSVIAIYVGELDFGQVDGIPGFAQSPFRLGLMILFATLVSGWAITGIGRAIGGQGDFDHVLLALSWMQWLQFLMQLGLTVLVYVFYPLAFVLQFVLLWYSLWIFINMINVMHKFENRLKATFVALAGSFIAVFILAGAAIFVFGGSAIV